MTKKLIHILLISAMLLISKQTALQSADNNNVIGVGFSSLLVPDADLKDVQVALKFWIKEIVNQLGMDYTGIPVYLEGDSAIINAVQTERVMVLTLHVQEYLELKNKIYLDPIIIPHMGESCFEDYILVAPRNCTDINQLENSNMYLLSQEKSLIPERWLEKTLKEKSINIDNFFNSVKKVKNEMQAILPIFLNQKDCALITYNAFQTITELNPQLGSETTILLKSPGYLKSIFCVTRNLPQKDFDYLVQSTDKLNDSIKSQEILKLFRFNKLVPFKQEYIKSVETLLDQ